MDNNGNKNLHKSCLKFRCDICDYYTSNRYNFKEHILTPKHQKIQEMITNDNINNQDAGIAGNLANTCHCGKKYKYTSGLSRHKKKCSLMPEKIQNVIKTNKTEPDVINMIMEVVKQNTEFKELIIEQNKQIIELSSKPTITNNTTNNNTTNNSFNLQFFLNETCKDALNITDFVSQLHVGIKDLEETGRLGYAEGISKIFINGLKQLEINQRPVHCSDAKRETIYIKDKNQWEKDDEEKVKLTKAIRSVAHKNIEQIAVWTEAHPEYMNYNSKYSEKYMKLIGEAMPGATYEESDKNYKKIARNITKETIIGK